MRTPTDPTCLGKALQPSSFILSWAMLNQLQMPRCSFVHLCSLWNTLFTCTAIPLCLQLSYRQQCWPVLLFLGSCVNSGSTVEHCSETKQGETHRAAHVVKADLGKICGRNWLQLFRWTWQPTILFAWLSICELSACHTEAECCENKNAVGSAQSLHVKAT